MITNVASAIRTVKYMWQSGREKCCMLGMHDRCSSAKLRGHFDYDAAFDRPGSALEPFTTPEQRHHRMLHLLYH